MKHAADFLTRHRRLFLIALLSVTLAVSSEANRRRLQEDAVVTSLPVMQTAAPDVAVATFTADRDAMHQRDVAALTALISQENIDSRTREDAAVQLQELIRNRECQQALESALASTALAPCTAVVTGSSVTLVTAKQEITPEDSALVLTLAAAHAGVAPEDVRILSAE